MPTQEIRGRLCITDASGNITRTYGHLPYGDTWYETGTSDKWKFTSYERDSETNLDYAMARFYSSRLGRFMSADPLGQGYPYVGNDPVNAIDPLGLNCMSVEVGGRFFPGCSTSIGNFFYGLMTSSFMGDEGLINVLQGSGWQFIDLNPQGPPPTTRCDRTGCVEDKTATTEEVPQNPCAFAGSAPDPSWYVAQVQQAGSQFLATGIDSGASLANQVNQLETLMNFRRGASLDAQPLGASPAYGNYVFGAALRAAGYSLSFTLSAANSYSFLSRAKYPGRTMDSNYNSIPTANVGNITNGFNAQQNGTLCHK